MSTIEDAPNFKSQLRIAQSCRHIAQFLEADYIEAMNIGAAQATSE